MDRLDRAWLATLVVVSLPWLDPELRGMALYCVRLHVTSALLCGAAAGAFRAVPGGMRVAALGALWLMAGLAAVGWQYSCTSSEVVNWPNVIVLCSPIRETPSLTTRCASLTH